MDVHLLQFAEHNVMFTPSAGEYLGVAVTFADFHMEGRKPS